MGGGLAGLAAGFELANAGFKVVVVEMGKEVVVSQTQVTGFDLTDEENSWLETFAYQPAVSPSTSLGIVDPSPEAEILGDQVTSPSPSPSPALSETDSSPPVLSTSTISSEDLVAPEFNYDLTSS